MKNNTMKLQRFYPLFAAIFVWHLRCIYEASIVSPIWWAYPLPLEPDLRVLRVGGFYAVLIANILYQVGLKKDDYDYFIPGFIIFLLGICLLGLSF